MGRLLLLFIGLPTLELLLLLELGKRIGAIETLALIVLTGIAGASLARGQGLRVVAEAQRELSEGRMPADALIDGVMILLASALLVTPGVLTDALGALCLIPIFREWVKRELTRRVERALAEGRLRVSVHSDFAAGGSGGRDPRSRDSQREQSWRDARRRGEVVDITAEERSDSSPGPAGSERGDISARED